MSNNLDAKDKSHVANYVWKRIERCEEYQDQLKPSRQKALEYYDNDLSNDLPSEDGKSSTVSPDLRGTIKKVMPSVCRTLFGNNKIVEYEPNEEGQEDFALQATNYVNHILVPECNAENALKDVIFDAFVLKTGILKWAAYESRLVNITTHKRVDFDTLASIEETDFLQITDIEGNEDGTVDAKIRTYEDVIEIKLEAVPRGAFLIDPDAASIEESGVTGERMILTRSELVERGYDKDTVWDISTHDAAEDNEEELERKGEDYSDISSGVQSNEKSMQKVEVYEVYVRMDRDDDGIAELYKIVMCDSGSDDDINGERIILEMTEADEVPYSAVVCERDAHQFEGHSIAEDVMPMQKLKTDLLRQGVNNIHWQTKLQPAYNEDDVTDEGIEAMMKPVFGQPIPLKGSKKIDDAVQFMKVPFVADSVFMVLQQLDEIIKDNTGINDQSGGLSPEAFQKMAATTAQIMNQAGAAQAEMILRSLSRGGIQKAFEGLLRLVVAHKDDVKSKRINGQWHKFDPSQWDNKMTCNVNIGLGAGSREQDMAMLQVVLALQEKLIAAFGNDNPFVKPTQLYNTIAKITEIAGFNSPDSYFSKPNEQEIQQKMQAEAQQPSPEEKKLQAEMQMKQAEKQMQIAVEKAQMEADERVEMTRSTMQKQIKEMEIVHKAELELARLNQQDQHHNDKMNLEYAKIPAQQPQHNHVGAV